MADQDSGTPGNWQSEFDPQLGGDRRVISEPDRQRAMQFFRIALEDIMDGRWAGAAAALRGTLDLAPGLSQVQGLLALTEELVRAPDPSFEQAAALQAYARQILIRQGDAGEGADREPAGSPGSDPPPAPPTPARVLRPLPPLAAEPPPPPPDAVAAQAAPEEEELPEIAAEAAPVFPWMVLPHSRLFWLLLQSPARFHRYQEQAGEYLVKGLGGWLFGLFFLILSVLTSVLLGLASRQGPDAVWAWGAVALALAISLSAGWLAANQFLNLAMTLVGGLLFGLSFLAAGMLSIAFPVVLIFAFMLALGFSLPFLMVDARDVVKSLAAGVGIVPASVVFLLGALILEPLIARMYAPTPLAGRPVFSYVTAGVAAIFPYVLVFALAYGLTYLLGIGIGFPVAYLLEGSPETSLGRTLRLAVAVLGIVLLFALVIIGALALR
jgi:hypothetical protein